MEAEAVLKMEIIVEHILNFLPVEDLKRARLVCRLWSSEGAKQILLKSYFRVPPRFRKEKSTTEVEKEKTLIFNFLHPQFNQYQEQLNEEEGAEEGERRILKLRPLPNVWISHVKDIRILLDLGVLSGNVKTLRFPPVDEFEVQGELDDYFEPTELTKWFKFLLSSDVHLTSLSSLYFIDSFRLGNPDIHLSSFHVEYFLKLNKAHLIKAFDFKSPWNRQIETLEKLVVQTPNLALESLVFGNGINNLRQKNPVLFSRAIFVLNQLLNSSAASLREIKVTDTLGSVNELEIPTLQNVNTLTVFLPGRNQNQNGNGNGNQLLVAQENSNPYPCVFPNMAESFCFPKLGKVTIGILGNNWMGLRVFKGISVSEKEILFPGLNPELKFSVYEYHELGVKNQLLISPPNSTPKESCFYSISQQVETSELDAERERVSSNIKWWCYYGWIFFLGYLILLPLIQTFVQNLNLRETMKQQHAETRRQTREIHDMVEGRIPTSVCVGMECTWKIPPIFACPKNSMDDTTKTKEASSFNSNLTWTLNLRQFTCQQATMYAAAEFKNEAFEFLKRGVLKL